jgi:U4/U6.U5 tri-snRNP-associated protein 2
LALQLLQAEAAELLIWLLNELHRGLGGSPKKPTVISKSFGGTVEVTTMSKVAQPVPGSKSSTAAGREYDANAEGEKDGDDAVGQGQGQGQGRYEIDANGDKWTRTVTNVPFTYLSLDIPPTPLFRDSEGGLIIPQIPLFEVLKKFDGQTWTDHVSVTSHVRKRYRILKLPDFLMFHLVRFTKNNFLTLEKNRTVVTFPVKNLSLKDSFFSHEETNEQSQNQNESSTPSASVPPKIEQLEGLSMKELKAVVTRWGSDEQKKALRAVIESDALRALARDACEYAVAALAQASKYDLLANICHDSDQAQDLAIGLGGIGGASTGGTSGGKETKAAALIAAAALSGPGGSFRVHTQNKATGQWFELQDLHVAETLPQQIGLSEAYILIYERKKLNGLASSTNNSNSASSTHSD